MVGIMTVRPDVTGSLIGREREFAEISEILRSSGRTGPNAVLIEGEAGIGKSHLLLASASSAQTSGWLVLMSHGYHLGGPGLAG
jgi:predicted ATP-dependent serine protease